MQKKFIIETRDSENTPVLLGEYEWKKHILSKHPEIKSFLKEIETAIKNPDVRQLDPEDERVYLYYYKISKLKQLHKKLKYLLVVIKYVNAPERNYEKTGFVSSVYFVRKIKRMRLE